MYGVPTEITVGEQSFTIRNRGDYRLVLDCFSCLSDFELTKQERIFACLIIFYEDFDGLEDLVKLDQDTIQQLIEEMFLFFNCGDENSGVKLSFKALDWDTDSHLICSAVNKVAHQEVRSVEYMHWWTFMGYFMEVGESVLATVVGIRKKMLRGKKMEKYEKEFIASNPQYFKWDSRTEQQREDDELFNEIWNKQ